MKKAIIIVALAFAVIALMGCPAVNRPALIGSGVVGSKIGQSSGSIILGMFGDVDAGVIAAAKAGGITKIGVVDTKVKTMLGGGIPGLFYSALVVTYTTTVSGE
jgi:hypothetical protein